jgi:hypothetical protein
VTAALNFTAARFFVTPRTAEFFFIFLLFIFMLSRIPTGRVGGSADLQGLLSSGSSEK